MTDLSSLSNDELVSLAATHGVMHDPTKLLDEALVAAHKALGRPEAFVRGLYQGSTANFGDELAGANAAGGNISKGISAIPVVGQIAAPAIGAARIGYEALTGKPSDGTAAYESTRDAVRAQTKEAEAEFPGTTLAGNITGAMAAPVGGLLKSATWPARIGRSGAVSGAYGAVSGAGEGEDLVDRAAHAATGGTLGAILGFAAPVAVGGAQKLGEGAAYLARPITEAIRGSSNPEQQAAVNVLSARARDARSLRPGLSDAEMRAAETAGQPVANVDRGGSTTLSLARSSANTSPEARAALEALSEDRLAGQKPRTVQWLNETFDFPDSPKALETIETTATKENGKNYLIARRDGAHGLWSPELERLTSSPDVVAAMKDAATKGKSRAVFEGYGGFNPGVTVDNGGIVTFQKGPSGVPTYPNLQFWDYTKRALDDAANEASRKGRKDEAVFLGGISRQLRTELDNLVPSYADARAGAAKWFGAENAVEAGGKFATMGGLDAIKLAQARGELAKMGPANRKLFEIGFVGNLISKIETLKDGQDIVKNIFNSEFARKQIALAVGPERAKELEAYLLRERAMNGLGKALGNSTTFRQFMEAGMAGATNPYTLAGATAGATSYLSGDVGPGDALAGAMAFAARKGKIKIDENVARRVGEMLASDDPGVLRRGLAMVARSDKLREFMRSLDLPTARISGQQSANVPALQSGATSRADEDQPNVPRPPSQ